MGRLLGYVLTFCSDILLVTKALIYPIGFALWLFVMSYVVWLCLLAIFLGCGSAQNSMERWSPAHFCILFGAAISFFLCSARYLL
jgi:hypothetical protein